MFWSKWMKYQRPTFRLSKSGPPPSFDSFKMGYLFTIMILGEIVTTNHNWKVSKYHSKAYMSYIFEKQRI